MFKKLRFEDAGITPVLGAMFILGIGISVIAVFLAAWVPSEFNTKKREYMQNARESFRDLSATIQDLSVGESRTISLKMGPETIPFIINPKVSGTLSVTSTPFENYENGQWVIGENYWENYPGNIKFDFENQSLVYEMGLIALVQGKTVLMESAPQMVTVFPLAGNMIGVYVDVIKVRGIERSISGGGASTITVSILRRFEKSDNMENAVIKINENSRCRSAWMEYLQGLFDGLPQGYHLDNSKIVDNLQLTILGKDNTTHGLDIIYSQKVTEVWVSIS
jgi:hypothetical protein